MDWQGSVCWNTKTRSGDEWLFFECIWYRIIEWLGLGRTLRSCSSNPNEPGSYFIYKVPQTQNWDYFISQPLLNCLFTYKISSSVVRQRHHSCEHQSEPQDCVLFVCICTPKHTYISFLPETQNLRNSQFF